MAIETHGKKGTFIAVDKNGQRVEIVEFLQIEVWADSENQFVNRKPVASKFTTSDGLEAKTLGEGRFSIPGLGIVSRV